MTWMRFYSKQPISIIDEYGWTQGISIDPATRAVCMFAAMQWAAECLHCHPFIESILRVQSELEKMGEPPVISQWNDKPGRFAEEVKALLRKAAQQ